MSINTLSNAAKTPFVSPKKNTDTQTAAPQTDADKTSGDYQDFLTLLTAQLKNQDPLQPLDSTSFVSQLAQFSNVEQQVKMNQKLDGLVTSLRGNDFSEASSFLGKYVSATGGKTYIQETDTQTSFNYQTATNVKSVFANITDRFGNDIKKISLPVAPKGASQNWDLTDKDNKKIEQGLYKITIHSTDDKGITTQAPAITRVKITQAEKTDTGFNYRTNTNEIITNTAIKTIHSQ